MDIDLVRKDLFAACAAAREGNAADTVDEAAVTTETAEPDVRRGTGTSFVALPGSTEEAAAVMRVAAEHGLAVVARGAGSRLSWGMPASRCDLLVDTSRMADVVEHASGDLVARVQAGARMGDVQATLARAGQEIALDVPGDATVGGVVASGLAGPRRLRYGSPRDLLIGITIVRADGTIAKSGGKVVKNVAGYDLGKLFAGSAGTLGLITEATFRLHPLPAARAFVTAEYVAVSVACEAVAGAANSPLVSSAVELSRPSPDGPIGVGVLLEGSAEGVRTRSLRMADLLGKGEISVGPPTWWPGALRAAAGETLIRLSLWVSALPRALDAIEAATAKSGVSPLVEGSAGAGVLYARIRSNAPAGSNAQTSAALGAESANEPDKATAGADLPASEAGAVAEFVAALRAAVAGERGAVVVLAAPPAVRTELADHGGMNGTVPGLALMGAVKDQFDPGHRMSPGRFPQGA